MLHDKILALQNDNSGNFKIQFLKDNMDDDILKQFFFLARNPKIKFWLKQIPVVECVQESSISLSEAFSELSVLSDRVLTGNAAKDHLATLMSKLDFNDQDIISRIIMKDPNCGVGRTTLNKIFGKKFIPIHPYMGAKSCTEKNLKGINFEEGAFVQTKCDGEYADIVYNGDSVVWMTRAGNEFLQMSDDINQEIKNMFGLPWVLQGELRISDGNGGYLDRKTGNGILNSAQQGMATPEEIKSIRFTVWDLITLDEFENEKSNVPYHVRYDTLKGSVDLKCFYINVVETLKVYSLKEALEFYKKKLQEGEEGAILKNLLTLWKSGKHKNQVKLKVKEPVDLLVVGTVPHKKKEGWIGSLICKSSCNGLYVKTGSGLSDDQRKVDPEEYIGGIVEVFSNGVIESKSKDTKSLYLPTLGTEFTGVRTDKLEADSLVEIEEKFNNILEGI